MSSVSTDTRDEDDSPGVATANGNEPPSTVSVVHANRVNEQQRRDSELCSIIKYLEDGFIPPEKKLAKRLVMERSRYDIIDGVFYYENPDVEGK